MNSFSDERSSELRELFFESAQELMQALDNEGLALEQNPGDAEILRHVRRIVHTLKGDSAAAGFPELSTLAHELEDALTPELAAQHSFALAELVFAAADTFQLMLAAYRRNEPAPPGDALRARLRALQGEAVAEPPAAPLPAAPVSAQFTWTEYEQMMIADALQRGEVVFNVALRVDPNCPMRAASLQLVRKVLLELGTVLALHPDDGSVTVEADLIEAALATVQPPEVIAKKCQIPAVVLACVVERVDPLALASHEVAALPQEPPAAQARVAAPVKPMEVSSGGRGVEIGGSPSGAIPTPSVAAESLLRVESTRIDDVMNLVGELIICKSMLARTVHEFDRRYAKDPLRPKFADALAFQSRVLDHLQKSVMKIRMVPVENLFRRVPRIVRDVARARSKDVALEIAGQQTDLDKSILDTLAEPLLHLVRNAVDHGIEAPEERLAAGKPARGTIRLNAYHQGNQVVIEIADDGRGMDPKKIVSQAVRQGLVAPEEAGSLSESESLDLIFRPGFSTAEAVTEVSGRGVGMDVVKSVLGRLKGTASVRSKPGEGTTIHLIVPLTLASIQALLFRAGGRLYAVPLSVVSEITRAQESEVHLVDGREVLNLRNRVLTLVRLNRLIEPDSESSSRRLFVVVVGQGDRRFGLVVDQLMGEEELVIKALDDQTIPRDLVSGASILGDGTVVLILNVAAVVTKLARLPVVGATA